MSFLRTAVGVVRERGLLGALKQAYNENLLYALLDGNLFHTKMRRVGATLIGEDKTGNKYFERMESQYGRHRWVEYKDPYNYNASTVPPEWHGWLHHISDYTPDKLEALKPMYHKEHKANLTGAGNTKIYLSKGHALNPEQREWTKVDGWQPSSTTSTP